MKRADRRRWVGSGMNPLALAVLLVALAAFGSIRIACLAAAIAFILAAMHAIQDLINAQQGDGDEQHEQGRGQ